MAISCSVLGGSTQTGGYNPRQYDRQPDNGFGLDDIIGSITGSNQRGSTSSGAGGLGDILGSVLGGQRNKGSFGGKGMLIAMLMPMVLTWIKNNGGVSGALSKITGMGYDKQARSWMSNQEDNADLIQMKSAASLMKAKFNKWLLIRVLMRQKYVKVLPNCSLR